MAKPQNPEAMDELEDVVLTEVERFKFKRKTRGNKGSSSKIPENHHPNVCVIREIYDSENANENFEQQLESALADSIETIVIEPMRLGDETARWIAVGNCLHKTAVLAGIGSCVASFIWPDKPIVYVPASILSALCTGLYSVSWQFDPCCKYQVEREPRELSRLALQNLNSSSPVVLVRRDDFRRKCLHSLISSLTLLNVGWRWYFPPVSTICGDIMQSSETGKLVISSSPNINEHYQDTRDYSILISKFASRMIGI